MQEIDHPVRQHKAKRSQSWPSAGLVWSEDHPINTHEFVRVELRQQKTRAVVDVRRWLTQLDGTTRPTQKGFAISVNHLPAIIDLLSAALAKVTATPAAANNELAKTATPPRSVSGGA
jgi:Transcriptional Coactivator p15 (PC4)